MAIDFPSSPSNGQVYTDSTSGNKYTYISAYNYWSYTPSGTSGTGNSSNTNILFNDSGAANGTAGFTFDKSTNNIVIANSFTVTGKLNVNTAAITIANTVGVYANGGYGSAGQALTSNGSAVYWSTIVGTNVDAQYTWTNTQIFTNTISYGSGTANGLINSTAFAVRSNSTVNTIITATSITQANTTATPFVANVTGLYHTGVVNAASHTTTGVTANATGVYPTSNTSGQNLGTSTQRWTLQAQSGDFSSTVNAVTSVNSALLSVGTTFTANATLVNAAAINVTGQTNSATIYATTSVNVGTLVQTNTTAQLLSSNSTVNTIITPTSFTQANTTATPFVANVTGLYHTGVVNAASHSVGTSFVANTSQVTIAGIPLSSNGTTGTAGFVLTSNGATGAPYWAAASAGVNVDAQYTWTNTQIYTNTISYGSGTANGFINSTARVIQSNSTVNSIITATSLTFANTTATPFTANVTGLYHTGTINAASHTTTGVTANVTGVYPTSNTSGQNLGTTTQRWVLQAQSGDFSTTVNAVTSVNSALLSVGTTFTANATLVNAAAINITGQTNSATIYATTSVNVGTLVQTNTTAQLISSNSTVNTVITPTSFTQANTTATPFVANVTGLYHTGTVNAASHTTTGFNANATAVLLFSNSTVNTIITPTSFTQANTTATPFVANVTGLYHTGTINAASFTIGTTLISNTLGVYHTGLMNAASFNTTGITINTTAVALGAAADIIFNSAAGISANGTFGTAGQALLTNATSVYWGSPSATPAVNTQNTNPTSPVNGQLYWNSDLGKTVIYYNDGNTVQWVEATQPGIIGPQGPTGPTGSTGPSGTVAVGTTSTGLFGTSASVTNSGNSTAANLQFTIPSGPSVNVGTTSTGLFGTSASVTNSGNTSNVVLAFTIPSGPSVNVGTTTTGNAGSAASVVNSGNTSNVVLAFTIPNGDKGGIRYNFSNNTANAAPGNGFLRFNNTAVASVTEIYVANVDINGATQDTYLMTWDDSTSTTKGYFNYQHNYSGNALAGTFRITGATAQTGYVKYAVAYVSGTLPANNDPLVIVNDRTGDKGDTGNAATVAVGTTTTGLFGTSASVTNSGNTSAATFNFTIPSGPSVSVGSTTTGAAGSLANVTNSGNTSNVVLAFTIPTGATGSTGATGASAPKSITIPSAVVNDTFTIFWTNTAITMAEIKTVVRGTSPSATATFSYGNSRATGTTIASGIVTSSTTTGVSTTTFTNAAVPANSFIWVTLTAVSGTVDEYHASLRFS